MDPETAKLVVELQLEDIIDLLDGLYDDDDIPEGNLRSSFIVIRCDLQRQLQILQGQVLVLKILRQEHEDHIAFSKLREEERQAATDHQLAMKLAGLSTDDPDMERGADHKASLSDSSDCDRDEQLDMAKKLYTAVLEPQLAHRKPLNSIETASDDVARTADHSTILSSNVSTKCCACMEVVSSKDTLTLQCKPEAHTYCRACLHDLFTSALVNTTLFPPRCCKLPIPLDTCRAMLAKELIKDFDRKVEELATPNPTYCSSAKCSTFICTRDVKADVGTCVFCGEKTCTLCKNSRHEGLCPSDPHVQLLMDVAKRSRWQQCTKCKNMVELEQGCFHMTCRCKHEFCYLCGVAWKTCTCPQWDENYLTRPFQAAAVVPTVAVPAPQIAAAHVHSWLRVNGAICQGCGANYLPYAMRCTDCGRTNCWRCIHNRG